jgi:hypothetical protein
MSWNGTSCRYVRGKKQQVGSEWLQHLRTFSSQPGMFPRCHASLLPPAEYFHIGRPDVTRSLSRPLSQPTLPQTPRLQPHHLEDTVSYARSPSPYLFEHIAIVDDGNQRTHRGGSPFNSQTSIEECSGNTPWLSSTAYGFMDPRSYLFQPAASLYDADFASNILITANNTPHFAAYSTLMRSYTSVSQNSETTCSYDGLSET